LQLGKCLCRSGELTITTKLYVSESGRRVCWRHCWQVRL
jgi:hypothetical protein